MFITEALRGSIGLLESDLCWHKLEAEIFSFLGIIYDLFYFNTCNEIKS